MTARTRKANLPGYDSLGGENVSTYGEDASGNAEAIRSTGRASHNRLIPGPQTQGRNRDLEDVTTRQKFEWPSGSNITELTLFAALSDKTITLATTTTSSDNAEQLASTDVSNIKTVFIENPAGNNNPVDISWSNDNTVWNDGNSSVATGAISAITVIAKYMKILQNGATGGNTVLHAALQLNDDLPVYGRVAVDAASDAIADALLAQLDDGSLDSGYIPIPLNTVIKIPLTDALSNGSLSGGRLDAISSDTSVALDFWIGGN